MKFADLVVRKSRVRSRSRDRRKRDVPQRAGRTAIALERFDRVDLGEPPSRRLGVEPRQKPRQSRAVALVRRTGAGELRLVLGGLHQRDRIGADLGLASRPLERLRQQGRRRRSVEADPRAELAKLLDKANESVRLAKLGKLSQFVADGRRQLPGVKEDGGTSGAGQIGESKRQGCMSDVGAANVEQPRQICAGR